MKKLTIILTVFFVTITMGLTAQNLKVAEKAYNSGKELKAEGDFLEAIESFEKCAGICAELGEAGEGLKLYAETKICNIYMDMGVEKFKVKNYDSAIILFTESDKYAQLIDDPSTTAKINSYFAASYTGSGNALYKTKKYKKAVENYNKAIEYNPEYPKAWYGLVLGYSKLDESGMLEESVKNVMEYSTDDKLKNKAKIAAGKYFLKSCTNALEEEQYNIAIAMADRSISYNNTDPNTFYYLAVASNGNKNWGNAQKAAMKAISFEQEDQSNYYFELGRAYEGQGDTEKACEAYSNVTEGPNTEGANYQRHQVLHCN